MNDYELLVDYVSKSFELVLKADLALSHQEFCLLIYGGFY